jgi:hypothetical protein
MTGSSYQMELANTPYKSRYQIMAGETRVGGQERLAVRVATRSWISSTASKLLRNGRSSTKTISGCTSSGRHLRRGAFGPG